MKKLLEGISQYRSALMGIATLWVLMFHYLLIFPDAYIPVITDISRIGNDGVEIFLVVSGMGLYYSLHNDSNVEHFYIKRIIRFVIPWLIMSFPYWILKTIIVDRGSLATFILNLFGISFWVDGTSTVWYVSLIIVLYLIYPFIYTIQKKIPIITIFTSVAVILGCFLLKALFSEYFILIEKAITRVPSFLIGSYLGGLLIDNDKKRYSAYVIYAFAVFAFLLLICGRLNIAGSYSIICIRVGSASVAMLVSFMFVFLLNSIKRKNFNTVLSKIGGASLEIYIGSVFIRNIFTRINFGISNSKGVQIVISIIAMLGALAFCYLFAQILHRILGRLFAKKVSIS